MHASNNSRMSALAFVCGTEPTAAQSSEGVLCPLIVVLPFAPCSLNSAVPRVAAFSESLCSAGLRDESYASGVKGREMGVIATKVTSPPRVGFSRTEHVCTRKRRDASDALGAFRPAKEAVGGKYSYAWISQHLTSSSHSIH